MRWRWRWAIPQSRGNFYNLADTISRGNRSLKMAEALGGSDALVEPVSTTASGPVFDMRKAVRFFDRHGNTIALRRGAEEGSRISRRIDEAS